MNSNLPQKPATKSQKHNQTKINKIVAFDDSQINSTSDMEINDTELDNIVQLNSSQIENLCISQLCPQSNPKPQINKQDRSNQSSFDLGLSSAINNTVVSIHLSPLSSAIKSIEPSACVWKLKRRIEEDKQIEVLNEFALEHQLQLQNRYNKCIIFRKVKPRTLRLFNCLMFKSVPELSMKIEILDMTNELKVSQISGKQEEFGFYFLELKKVLWKNNVVKFDEIESINLFIELNHSEFLSLFAEYKNIERQGLSPSVLESTMQMTMELRERIITLAKQKDNYLRIKVQQFIDRRLFNNLHMFNLYKKAYSSPEEEYQLCRDRLIKSLTISMQFQYLQIKVKDNETRNPYRQAIDELSKLNVTISPFEKLEIIKDTYELIKKSCCWQGKGELNLLPMVIFVVLNSKVSYMYANIYMMEHFLEHVEGEKQQVSNLYVAAEYITNSWKST